MQGGVDGLRAQWKRRQPNTNGIVNRVGNCRGERGVTDLACGLRQMALGSVARHKNGYEIRNVHCSGQLVIAQARRHPGAVTEMQLFANCLTERLNEPTFELSL